MQKENIYRRNNAVIGALLLLVPITMVFALMVGSVPVSIDNVLQALFSDHASQQTQVIQQLRLPRALGAFSCGALLAIAGVLMQVLLRNPLADPYVLGISGGAAVAEIPST